MMRDCSALVNEKFSKDADGMSESEIAEDVQKGRQQRRNERKADAYFVPYVEALSDARTMLAAFFNIR